MQASLVHEEDEDTHGDRHTHSHAQERRDTEEGTKGTEEHGARALKARENTHQEHTHSSGNRRETKGPGKAGKSARC